ncbi:ATP-dependent Clp protease proteolytic subunit 1, partial [Chlamydia psittaci 06-1683]
FGLLDGILFSFNDL